MLKNPVVYRDGSDTVAVDTRGNEVARDVDAGRVLQAAADNLPGTGDRIDLGRGKFEMYSGCRFGVPVELVGRGMANPNSIGQTMLYMADGANIDMLTFDGDSRPPDGNASGLVKGLTLHGNKAKNDTGDLITINGEPDVQVNRTLLWDAPQDAVNIGGGHIEFWLTNSWIEHARRWGLRVYGGRTTYIGDSYIIDNEHHNVIGHDTTGLSVTGSWIDGSAGVTRGDNIQLDNVAQFSIVGNPRINGAGRAGVYCYAQDGNRTVNGTIVGNNILDNGQGIRMDGDGTVDYIAAGFNTLTGNDIPLAIADGANGSGCVGFNPGT